MNVTGKNKKIDNKCKGRTNPTVAIISQYACVSKHHIAHLKIMCQLHLVKLGGKSFVLF